MGSNGQVGTHNSYLVEGPSVIVGRKGSAGQIVWEEKIAILLIQHFMLIY